MRLFRMLLPITAVLIMMFADGNQTALNIAYVMLGITAVLFGAGFVKDLRRAKDRD